MTGLLVVIRHGETEWSASGRHTGKTDLPLTEEGRHQADQLVERVADRPFALVLSSPLVRARDTAERAGLSDQVEVDDRMVEWDYGDYEGMTTAEIRQSVPGWTVWSHPCPGGETATQVAARADAVLERARVALQDGDVALVAHGHFLRVLTARWLGYGPSDGSHFLLDPATISELGHDRGDPAIARWNV